MTNDEKLLNLIKVLKDYAESEHCFDMNEDFESDSPDYSKDQVFDVAAKWGEITLARTLLEQICKTFEYPCGGMMNEIK